MNAFTVDQYVEFIVLDYICIQAPRKRGVEVRGPKLDAGVSEGSCTRHETSDRRESSGVEDQPDNPETTPRRPEQ